MNAATGMDDVWLRNNSGPGSCIDPDTGLNCQNHYASNQYHVEPYKHQENETETKNSLQKQKKSLSKMRKENMKEKKTEKNYRISCQELMQSCKFIMSFCGAANFLVISREKQ